jgi:hypothetical protein
MGVEIHIPNLNKKLFKLNTVLYQVGKKIIQIRKFVCLF